ncbi:Sporulation domain protein [Magnetococcus marinus MC-1]|uniref:Sporulation domain protein n=1 Tax=Magnetococcus marinus (strain ATCC BAA-1437 / JCM 17883 / MC-1) TaxID=156889 RepID=A0L7L4_MAGMM|nr:SPOR domain-containing protein [Magnetococcus marinus]ABK43957.1 Sporulation domain protein [Magnetococcus marinus MC-1]
MQPNRRRFTFVWALLAMLLAGCSTTPTPPIAAQPEIAPPANRVVLNWYTRDEANLQRPAHVQVWLQEREPAGEDMFPWQASWQQAIEQHRAAEPLTVNDQVVQYRLTSLLNHDGTLLTMILRVSDSGKTVWVGNMPANLQQAPQTTQQALNWIQLFLSEQAHPITRFAWRDTPFIGEAHLEQAAFTPNGLDKGRPQSLEEEANRRLGKRPSTPSTAATGETVEPETAPIRTPAVEVKRRWAIQVESDRSPSQAESSRAALMAVGLPAYVTPTADGDWFLVRVGPFYDEGAAQQAYDTLQQDAFWQKRQLYPVVDGRTRFEYNRQALWQ